MDWNSISWRTGWNCRNFPAASTGFWSPTRCRSSSSGEPLTAAIPNRRALRACLRTCPVRGPGLQEVEILAVSCRPRALTRRFGGVFKQALGRDDAEWHQRKDAARQSRNQRKGARNLFRFTAQSGLIDEKRLARKNHRTWKRNKFRAPESSRAARILPYCTTQRNTDGKHGPDTVTLQ